MSYVATARSGIARSGARAPTPARGLLHRLAAKPSREEQVSGRSSDAADCTSTLPDASR